ENAVKGGAARPEGVEQMTPGAPTPVGAAIVGNPAQRALDAGAQVVTGGRQGETMTIAPSCCCSSKIPTAARARRTRYSVGACVFVLVASSARGFGPSARRSATRSLATTERAIDMPLPKTNRARAVSGVVFDEVSVDMGKPPGVGTTRETVPRGYDT